MLNLASSLGRTRGVNAPPPLPTVFRKLAEERKVFFRRSQLSMVGASSGVGKTILAQWHALHAGVPTLYFSGDTDETTMAERASAMLTGTPQETIRDMPPDQMERYADLLFEKTSHISWDYATDHSFESIEQTVQAFGMVHGEWPALIVFDVLMSYQPGAGGWDAMNDFILLAASIATETQAHVMILHHASGAYADKTLAPPKSGLLNKNDQLFSLILTMGLDGDQWNIAVVKNRNGPSDVRAENPIRYGVNTSTCTITEPRGFYG